MSSNEPKTEWIRLVASPTDKALLEAIASSNGDESISAAVRRLIRQEARRNGIVSSVDSTAAAVDRATRPAEAGAGGHQVGDQPASTTW